MLGGGAYWRFYGRCAFLACKGLLKTSLAVRDLLLVTEHDVAVCWPDPDRVQVAQKVSGMKRRAIDEPHVPCPRIYNDSGISRLSDFVSITVSLHNRTVTVWHCESLFCLVITVLLGHNVRTYIRR